MDSKFQFRDASPPPTAWAPSFRRVSGGSLSRRNCSIGLPRPTPTDVLVSKRDRGALGALQPAQIKINANNTTVRNRLGQAESDRPGATAAIGDRRARTEVRYQETRVDVCTSQLYRSL